MRERQTEREKEMPEEKKARFGQRLRPAVDVLIPVYHPGPEFEELMRKLQLQTLRPERIIILETVRPEDFDPGRFDKYGDNITVIPIAPEEFDHGATRDRGARASRADVLLFMTQDAVPADEELVEKLAEKLMKIPDKAGKAEEEIVAAAYARQLPREDCRLIERYTRDFNYPEKSRIKSRKDLADLGIKTYFCSNVCAAYRRDIYLEQGGFLQRTIFNEDMIFAAKLIGAGYGIAYAADARVIHSHNYSGFAQLHRNFDLAVSQADHPEIFSGLPSEGEGLRLVKSTAGYLLRQGKFWLIPALIWQSGCKYLGYLLGKHYKSLPRRLVLALTMNKRYWNHETES